MFEATALNARNARIQKLVPKPNADKARLIGQQYFPPAQKK